MQDLSSEDPALQLPLESVAVLNIGIQFTSFTGTKVQSLTQQLQLPIASVAVMHIGTYFTCFAGTKVQILTLQCSLRPAFGQGGKTSGQRL